MKKLIDAEYVVSDDTDSYYLTDDGKTIAMGALQLYPEMHKL